MLSVWVVKLCPVVSLDAVVCDPCMPATIYGLFCYFTGVVVTLARKYRVSLPVLTAVAQVLNGHLNAKEAVYEIMNLPQIEER